MLVYSRAYIAARGMFRGEFFALALFATLGMMVMISANHLLTLYLGLELMSLSLYSHGGAAARFGGRDRGGDEVLRAGRARLRHAALRHVDDLRRDGHARDHAQLAAAIAERATRSTSVLVFGLVFVVAGHRLQAGRRAVPHVGAGRLSRRADRGDAVHRLAPKLAAFAFIMRLLAQASAPSTSSSEWQQMLIVLAVLSLAIGNITAIAQTNLKRMLAYSTISHMGFLLLGILAGDARRLQRGDVLRGRLRADDLGSFGMILLLSREGFEAEKLDDFKGLNQRSPWYAFVMLLLMFSMAGVPPTVGLLREARGAAGGRSTRATSWLAVVAVLFSLVGAFYYLRVVKLMYFDAPDGHRADRAARRRARAAER